MRTPILTCRAHVGGVERQLRQLHFLHTRNAEDSLVASIVRRLDARCLHDRHLVVVNAYRLIAEGRLVVHQAQRLELRDGEVEELVLVLVVVLRLGIGEIRLGTRCGRRLADHNDMTAR